MSQLCFSKSQIRERERELKAQSNLLKFNFNRLPIGFTLIELLVVIAILAVLATVAVVLINPTELLKQARDSRRLSELGSLNKVLQTAEAQSSSLYFGSSSVVYVSIPDTSPTCANLNFPSLPTGWSYSCKTSGNFRKVNGTGWIPVNFASLSIGAPFSSLPVDPVNNATSSQYYTYIMYSSWSLTVSSFESEKYAANKHNFIISSNNSNFNSSIGNWDVQNYPPANATFTYESGNIGGHTGSGKYTVGSSIGTFYARLLPSYLDAITVGKLYKVSVDFYRPSGTSNINLKFYVYGSSELLPIDVTNIPTNNWTTYTGYFVADGNWISSGLAPHIYGAVVSGENFYIDNVKVYGL